ncbi:MAG: phage major capsid protein [Pseudomonadota bacterium]
MLNSVKITRRQSEIRQALSALVGKEKPTEDELRNIEAMDLEFRSNETRYRAALIAEDAERREAGADLETRSGKDWADLVQGFELRQIALALDEGRALNGRTAEVVQELRAAGGFRGMPIPWQALERRVGETIASATPNPLSTMPIIDRLFPGSVAARMGAQMIAIPSGLQEWPVVTSSVTAGWQATETGTVAGPTTYATTDKSLAPNNTLGVQLRITRKALLQTGSALEDATRRDLNGAIGQALDQAVFLGTGTSGQPLGVIPGISTYGITATVINAAATWGAFRSAIARFMGNNAATGAQGVKVLIRPEVWSYLDGLAAATAAPMWEYDRLVAAVGADNVTISASALAALSGSPLSSSALLTTTAGGSAPIYVGMWGAVDLIRDPYSDAQSGGLRLTALATMDVTVARGAQIELLTGVRVA